jgi:hypothetical protein
LEDRALLSATAAEECAGWLSCNSSKGLIELDVSCPAYTLERQDSGDYQLVASALTGTTEGGTPALPGRLLRIALPMDADLDTVSLAVEASSSTTLAGSFALTPAAVAATDSEDGGVLLATIATLDAAGRNVEVYATNAVLDAECGTLLSTQQMGRWKIAEVYYSPFAYNPVTGKVQVVEEASFTLSYSGGDSLPAALAANTNCDADAEEVVVNTADAAAWYPASSGAETKAASYVIITTAAIEANSTQLANFVAAKEAAGYTVAVETESDWGGGTGDTAAEHIRSWLQDNYATLGIQYVLLIGNPTPTTGNVPMKMAYPRSFDTSDRESPSDYYYADLTSDWDTDDDGVYGEWIVTGYGGDFSTKPLHEVIVGRIPVYGTAYSTLDSILSKTIAYGNEEDISWRENLLLPMAVSNYAQENGGTAYRCDGSALGEYITTNLADPYDYSTYRLYEQAGLTPVTTGCEAALTNSNVLSAWTTNTYGIVDWWGHGSEIGAYRKYWFSDADSDGYPDAEEMNWDAFIDSGDATSLNNSHPSVVFQISCTNGYPEYAENLGYSLLKNGAVATYSASRVSWYAVASWVPAIGTAVGDNASYAYYSTKLFVEDPENETTGSVLQWCRENLGTAWADASWMNCLDFNLYGDPTLTPLYAAARNDAPVLDNSGAMSLTSVYEDASSSAGTLVSAIIASAGGDRITDVDHGAVEGIAVTAVVNANGTWQYSLNDGATWASFGTASNTAARLLASDTTTRIRFVPNTNWYGSLSTGITFRAWDRTSGTNGGTADSSVNGDATAFSTATETASIVVEPVNDEPAGTDATLSMLEDGVYTFAASNFGFSDPVEGNSLARVTIASLPTAGTLLFDGAAVTAGQAVDADAIDQLTFTPVADAYGTVYSQFTFQVQDNGGTARGGVDLDATPNTITFDVSPVNDAPMALRLENATIAESLSAGSLVGNLRTTDVDVDDIFEYTLLNNAGGRFSIEGEQLLVADDSLIDFETATSHVIRVQTTDSGGASLEREFTITITNVNESPTDVQLSGTTVVECSAAGTLIGALTATDPDADDTCSYSLVDNANGRFKLQGNQLVVNNGALLDFEAATSHQITVRATDAGGKSYAETFTIDVLDCGSPDLRGAQCEVPNLLAWGRTFKLQYQVTNAGEDVALGGFQQSFYLSSDAVWGNGDDLLLGTATYVVNLAAGTSGTVCQVALELPEVPPDGYTASGPFYIGMYVDCGAVTPEADETNNMPLTVGLGYDADRFRISQEPTDLALSNSVVVEHSAVGTVIGVLTTTDPDADDSFSYVLLDSAGTRFRIREDQLLVDDAALLDYEIATQYKVTVRAVDCSGLSCERDFTIEVTNVNEAPRDIVLSGATVAENSPTGTLVGMLSSVDTDAGDTFTYTLLDSAGGRFKLEGNQVVVDDNTWLDYETASSLTILVRSTDSYHLSLDKLLTIEVTDVDETPTDIRLSNATVAENSASGTVVGSLAITGIDAGDTFTFALLDSAGGRFKLDGAQVVVDDGTLLDYERATWHVISVQATDSEGVSLQKEFTIAVTDVDDVVAIDSVAVFNPATSTFYLRCENTSGAADYTFAYGAAGEGWESLVGDWDGDGSSGVGLYDEATSTFYLTSTYATGVAEYTFGYGVPDGGWVPLVGDWDGNGTTGVGLYDPATSMFYLTNALATGTAEYTFGYGVPNGGWIPIVGDWDGSGTSGVGLYDPSTSTFYLTNALATGVAEYTFGYGVPSAGWEPMVGDWNGNGATGVGLYDPAGSTFYLTDTLATGSAEITFAYGVAAGGWEPLVGDWNGDGASGVGLYDPTGTTFYLSNALATGVAEHMVQIAEATAGCVPLVGCWRGPAAAGVDAVDLADLACAALEPEISLSLGNGDALDRALAGL